MARIKSIAFASQHFDREIYTRLPRRISCCANASAVLISQHGRSFALRFDAFNPISIISNSLWIWIHCVIHAHALHFSIYTTDLSCQVTTLDYCYGFYSDFFLSAAACMNAFWNCLIKIHQIFMWNTFCLFDSSHPLVCIIYTHTITVERFSDTPALIKHDSHTFRYTAFNAKRCFYTQPNKKQFTSRKTFLTLTLSSVSTFHIENLHFTLSFWAQEKKNAFEIFWQHSDSGEWKVGTFRD